MAWIPSHQELRSHPKTRKAARRAGVSLPTMIGHLHLLWYWALDLAEDGDLAKFDDEDIADGAGWEDDPEVFVQALVQCGSGGGQGFLTADRRLHDWDEYGGKYAKRVESARRAAASRWHPVRDADEGPPDTEGNADAMPPHSAGNAEERRGEERTVQTANPSVSDLRPDTPEQVAVDVEFEQFWLVYPPRHGKKRGRGNALIEWRKLTAEQRHRALIGARHLAASDDMPKDAERFLRRGKGGKGDWPFDDYQTPPPPRTPSGRAGPAPPAERDADYLAGFYPPDDPRAQERTA